MSAPVQSMRGDEMLYRALGRMDRLRVRHLCVADASGAPIGMVSQRDLRTLEDTLEVLRSSITR